MRFRFVPLEERIVLDATLMDMAVNPSNHHNEEAVIEKGLSKIALADREGIAKETESHLLDSIRNQNNKEAQSLLIALRQAATNTGIVDDSQFGYSPNSDIKQTDLTPEEKAQIKKFQTTVNNLFTSKQELNPDTLNYVSRQWTTPASGSIVKAIKAIQAHQAKPSVSSSVDDLGYERSRDDSSYDSDSDSDHSSSFTSSNSNTSDSNSSYTRDVNQIVRSNASVSTPDALLKANVAPSIHDEGHDSVLSSNPGMEKGLQSILAKRHVETSQDSNIDYLHDKTLEKLMQSRENSHSDLIEKLNELNLPHNSSADQHPIQGFDLALSYLNQLSENSLLGKNTDGSYSFLGSMRR